MLASIWPMKAPTHTVPTTNQRYEASRAMARRGGGSRPLSTASRSAAIEAGPGDESVTSGFGSRVGLFAGSAQLQLRFLSFLPCAGSRASEGAAARQH